MGGNIYQKVDAKNAPFANSEEQYTPGYQENDDFKLTRSWTTKLADDTLISALSIPGTHDSCSYSAKWYDIPPISQCQSWSVKKQLMAGVRYLDIRVKIPSWQKWIE